MARHRLELDIALAQGQTFGCTIANSILHVTGDIALGSHTLLADDRPVV